jgi:outer membrane immunogenic protein
MKNTLLVATALTALSFSAFAADVPARTLAPVSPAPIFSWTGFYVGGTVGSLTARFSNFASYNNSEFDPPYSYAYSSKRNAASATLSAAAGYNHQVGNIVAGLEADYNFSKATYDTNEVASVGSFGTFRGRLGYAIDRTMIFATAGVAVTQLSGRFGFASYNEFSSSWVAGGGVEYALTNMLTVKAEALYADFGSASDKKTDGLVTAEAKAETSAVIGRMGMNFKF